MWQALLDDCEIRLCVMSFLHSAVLHKDLAALYNVKATTIWNYEAVWQALSSVLL